MCGFLAAWCEYSAITLRCQGVCSIISAMASETLAGLVRRLRTAARFSVPDVWEQLKGMNVEVAERSLYDIEQGKQLRPRPDVINHLATIIPGLSVAKMVDAMGYEVGFDGIEGEEEVELLRAYRSLPDLEQKQLRGVLGIEGELTAGELLRSLLHLAEMDLQGRQGTQG